MTGDLDGPGWGQRFVELLHGPARDQGLDDIDDLYGPGYGQALVDLVEEWAASAERDAHPRDQVWHAALVALGLDDVLDEVWPIERWLV